MNTTSTITEALDRIARKNVPSDYTDYLGYYLHLNDPDELTLTVKYEVPGVASNTSRIVLSAVMILMELFLMEQEDD